MALAIPFALGKPVQEWIASGNSPIMHFLGNLVLALSIIIAAMIIAFAFRFTPVVERKFDYNNNHWETTSEDVLPFDHWTGK